MTCVLWLRALIRAHDGLFGSLRNRRQPTIAALLLPARTGSENTSSWALQPLPSRPMRRLLLLTPLACNAPALGDEASEATTDASSGETTRAPIAPPNARA